MAWLVVSIAYDSYKDILEPDSQQVVNLI